MLNIIECNLNSMAIALFNYHASYMMHGSQELLCAKVCCLLLKDNNIERQEEV
jgi:hypothetical protein